MEKENNLDEFYDKFEKDLRENQEPLGDEFEKVLKDNYLDFLAD